ncbi:MAG TPA: serine hydrolase, partial [Flavisolibacter sp.]|nr:serine hydrolase [Flavisolibacter sp.]
DNFLKNLVRESSPHLDSLLRTNDQYHIKIIYTKVDRSASGKPSFTNYYYNADPSQYFYPASTVKMPVALLALQKLNQLKQPGLDKHTTMITEAAYSGQTQVYNDPSSVDGRPTVAHYIKKIFLVSDNDAFNRLYEFLGQEYINESLHKMGYDSAQVLHRLDVSLTEDENRATNPVKFYDSASKIIWEKPLLKSGMAYQPRNTFLGNGFMKGGKLINEPFDFSKKNRFTLIDLHSILMSVIFPEAVPKSQRFQLTKEDYAFLYKYMSMKPGESKFPQYDSSFNEAYSKLLLFGGKGKIEDPNIRIFNKEGDAYGFLTDVAYIVDHKNNVEFFLSANIYCNSDGVFNDDHYDYEAIGFPFLKELGQVLYKYELKRPRKHRASLDNFKISYD